MATIISSRPTSPIYLHPSKALRTWRCMHRQSRRPTEASLQVSELNSLLPSPTDPFFSNPKAPLFPAFKDSVKGLPSNIYDPYPEYNTPAWRKKWRGEHEPCLGPRGVDVNENADDMLVVHRLQKQRGLYM